MGTVKQMSRVTENSRVIQNDNAAETRHLFGTDGIRGVANVEPMTAETVLDVARAAAYAFKQTGSIRRILIGKDTRQSGYMLENALTAGFCSMGMDVLLVGPLPTPGVSYIMRSLRADAAVMISASHNPYSDNGIKFFAADGFKLPDEVEVEIERLIGSGEVNATRPTGGDIGGARRIDDAVGRYIEYAKATVPKGMRFDGLRVVVDCANGAAYKVGPICLRELGAEVIPIANDPDGRNINEGCGSVHPDEMRARVIRERADLGIAFDGDGDRLVAADHDGALLDGNAILAILAADLLERGALPHNTLVTTIMANGGLERALRPLGGKIVRTKVGDRYVVEAMRQEKLVLGGESSGHIVMLEHNTTGDALITALQLMATMRRKGQTFSELAGLYEAMPEAHSKVPLNGKPRPDQGVLDKVRDEAELALGGKGRIVIRPSGTEPIVRVMVQHEASGAAKSLAEELARKISAL